MTAAESPRAAALPRDHVDLGAVFELGKPRLAVPATAMSLCGFLLAADGAATFGGAALLASGMLLVSFGSAGLNMVIERHADARMHRTSTRPLPSGRITVAGATTYSIGCVLTGLVALSFLGLGACGAAACMAVLYVGVYTPLKQRTEWNTVVGALPGAFPATVGTIGAADALEPWGVSIFALTFFWQIPHFLPLAHIYRDDYVRGGMRMLPAARDGAGRSTRWLITWTGATLMASALPLAFDVLTLWAALPLTILGGWFGLRVWASCHDRGEASMRRLFRASLIYLGLLLATFVALGA
ncbi:MAG: protoheme IX farnesyltransferase [Planctomycetota bacterium]